MIERGEPVPNLHDPAACHRCREHGAWPELRAGTDDAQRVARERAGYGWRRVYGVDPAASSPPGSLTDWSSPSVWLVRDDRTPTGRLAAAHLDAWVRDRLRTDLELVRTDRTDRTDRPDRPDRTDRTDRTDRGVEPTVTEPTTVTEAVAAASAEPTPLRLTYEGLRDLGACGPYLSKFRERFPHREYPNGVELTLATCREHWRSWDWTWAVDVMLTEWGRGEYWRIVNGGARELRERFGTGEARRGAVLGYLLHRYPTARSPRLVEVTTPNPERERQRADQAALTALDHGRSDVVNARVSVERLERDLTHWRSELARREALLPALEEAAAVPLLRRADREAQEAVERVARVERDAAETRARLERQVERARTQAEAATAELERLRAAVEATTTATVTDPEEEPCSAPAPTTSG